MPNKAVSTMNRYPRTAKCIGALPITRHRGGFEDRADDAEVGVAVERRFGLEHQAMRQHPARHRLHVVRRDEVDAAQSGVHARRAQQRQRAARRQAERHARVFARGARQVQHVVRQCLGDMQRARRGARLVQQRAIDDADIGRNRVARFELGAITPQDLAFRGALRVVSCRCAA